MNSDFSFSEDSWKRQEHYIGNISISMGKLTMNLKLVTTLQDLYSTRHGGQLFFQEFPPTTSAVPRILLRFEGGLASFSPRKTTSNMDDDHVL
jgi:hypothetical protein